MKQKSRPKKEKKTMEKKKNNNKIELISAGERKKRDASEIETEAKRKYQILG